MAITAVGTIASGAAAGKTTQAVTPATLGNCQICAIGIGTTGAVTVASVSGGGCNASGSGQYGAWTRIAGPFNGGNTSSDIEIWMGSVITTGSGTITYVGSSSVASFTNRMVVREFTAGFGLRTRWLLDAAGTKTNTTSTTITFPTLVASFSAELYIGWGIAGTTASTSGATSGYTVQLDPNNNPFMWNASVSGSQSPTCAQSPTGLSNVVSAIIYATPYAPSMFMPLFGMGHHEDELEQRSSGLYVQRRKISGIKPNGGKRVLAHV
jgi:hypothetical protein